MKTSLFLSYSHSQLDYKYRKELEKHLITLAENGKIIFWSDEKINAGDEWDKEINEKLKESQIIILLISSDFLNSRYIKSVELSKAFEKHKNGECKIIPVILSHCDWMSSSIGQFHAIPSKNGKILPIKNWKDKAEAFFIVVKEIEKSLNKFTNQKEMSAGVTENSLNQNANKEITILLNKFSEYLDNRRVLYLPFDDEYYYPLKAMTSSVTEMREELVSNIIPQLPINSDERRRAQEMALACRSFNDPIMRLPNINAILQDTLNPLNFHGEALLKTVEMALIQFRKNFIQPMYWLLTQHRVNIPDGILRFISGLSSLKLPEIIYAQGLPVKPMELIYYAGDSQSGYFLRICTIAENTKIGEIVFPANSELIFYDPKEVNMSRQVWQVTVGDDCEIQGRQWKKGDKFYFDLEKSIQMEDPNPSTFIPWNK